MEQVAIVGAGLIGRAWAAVFARAGWAVRLHDPHGPTLDAAPGLVQAELAMLRGHGLADGEAGAVTAHPDLAGALDGASFVQECGPESLAAKQALSAEMDRLAPPAVVLASSTSAIVASSFTEALPGRGRCLVGHPVNPPHLIPLVELCGAAWTEPAALDRAAAVYTATRAVTFEVFAAVPAQVLGVVALGTDAGHAAWTDGAAPGRCMSIRSSSPVISRLSTKTA